jgi:hypothetical protein
MRLKAAISLLFVLTVITTASAYFAAGQSNTASNTNGQDEAFEARRQNFKSGREMLLDKGVTFEPEELLREHRSKALQDALDAMPEMHQSRRETAPLRGVYLADTLYLPEKVQLSGHTIIVANYVVFEGKNPVIRGHYDLNFFPAKPVAVLGTTLTQALHKKNPLVNVRLGGRPVLPSFSLIQDLGDRRTHNVTIDTSGPAPQALRSPPRKTPARLTGVSWHGFPHAILPLQTCSTGCDTSGVTGNTGASGAPGAPGANGISPANAPDGNCTSPSTGSNNGIDGANGQDGGNGKDGGNGQPGGNGGDAGNINAVVADGDTTAYNFIAGGGRGGLGGEAGNGGAGGDGGNGANGGNGVACGCQVGTGGDSGSGSRGGDAGAGGNGGPGGTGGNGASITVSLPFNGSATWSNSGGLGGMGGSGATGGIGGNGGFQGRVGIGATACGQTAANGNFALEPSPGNSGAAGNAGANGASGLAGPAASITHRSAPPPPAPTPTPGCASLPLASTADSPSPSFAPIANFTVPPVECDPSDPTMSCPCTPTNSPIIVDLTGDGFFLTSAANGVNFDIANSGTPIQIAWTANANNAFLVLDRLTFSLHALSRKRHAK